MSSSGPSRSSSSSGASSRLPAGASSSGAPSSGPASCLPSSSSGPGPPGPPGSSSRLSSGPGHPSHLPLALRARSPAPAPTPTPDDGTPGHLTRSRIPVPVRPCVGGLPVVAAAAPSALRAGTTRPGLVSSSSLASALPSGGGQGNFGLESVPEESLNDGESIVEGAGSSSYSYGL